MPAREASAKRKKPIKLLIFGDTGTGKTHFLLSAPSPLVCDTEAGTDLFEGREGFKFSVWEDEHGMKTTSVKEVRKAMDYVLSPEGRKKVKTFCIDPYSAVWDDIQIQRQDYKESKKKFETSNEADISSFNQLDWTAMKKLHKSIVVDIVNLPVHVIVSCREKEVSETLPNGDIKKTGEYIYDGEKNMKYLFDVVMRLCYDEKQNRRYAVVIKSRSQFFKKGQIIEEPTFNIFDEIINNMKDMKVASGLSNKEENVFIDADKKEELPAQKLVSTTSSPPAPPVQKPTPPTIPPAQKEKTPEQASEPVNTISDISETIETEEDFKVIVNNSYNKLKSFRGKVDPVLIQKAAATAPNSNFKNITNIEQAKAVEKAVNELEKFVQE